VLADGEVSSLMTGNGIGGRNSAFVPGYVRKIADRGITVLSAGTGGIDGNNSRGRYNCGWLDAEARAGAGH
jgi:glycerate-2-kinase